MKPSDIFGIAVRLVGFVIIIYGLWNIVAGLEIFAEVSAHVPRPADEQYSPVSYLAMGIPQLLLGAFCFFFADWVVRLTYREK